jgi:excisionase family DNA binding protein
MEDRWLSVEEAASHLGVSRDTVYRWIDHRGLPAHKVGRLWKFKKEEIDAWVRAGHAEESDEGSSGAIVRSDVPGNMKR